MYKNLVLYRNELKNKSIYKYKVMGIVSDILLSKKIFLKNSDINFFLKEVFDIEFKDYIMKSRTLITSHVIKVIYNSEDDSSYRKKLLSFISDNIETFKLSEALKEEKNDFDGWIK